MPAAAAGATGEFVEMEGEADSRFARAGATGESWRNQSRRRGMLVSEH